MSTSTTSGSWQVFVETVCGIAVLALSVVAVTSALLVLSVAVVVAVVVAVFAAPFLWLGDWLMQRWISWRR